MPSIEPFRGTLYNLSKVGKLGDVVAPPYDVIDAELQEQLYQRHPNNVVRLILNRGESGDEVGSSRYTRAASLLRKWRDEQILVQAAEPALYVYRQVFRHDGQTLTRSGFMARLRLQRFGEGKIYPHEQTHAAAKADRLDLLRVCRTNLSQIFGVYPDPHQEVSELLTRASAGSEPLQATDEQGVIHQMWPVTDLALIEKLQSVLGPKPLFIADGHHRYETACNYRDELAGQAPLAPDHPAQFVLAMCVSMSDPGMVVLPTHRLFRGLPPLSAEQLCARLQGDFDLQPGGEGPARAVDIWAEIEGQADQRQLALYTEADRRWTLARLTPEGQRHLAKLAAEQSETWRRLGVSILHKLILENLLDATGLPKPMYVHDIDAVVSGLEQGDTLGRDATGQQGQGGAYPLAALVMPATLEHVRAISENAERMPAKSTYFYPKLLSGLVFHSLEP